MSLPSSLPAFVPAAFGESPLFSHAQLLAVLGGAAVRFDVAALAECDSTNAVLSTLAGQAPSGTVIVAGMLASLNVMRTKKGDQMARAVLEDLHGSVNVIFFPRCFSECQQLLASEEPLVIKANINLNQNNQNGAGGGDDDYLAGIG